VSKCWPWRHCMHSVFVGWITVVGGKTRCIEEPKPTQDYTSAKKAYCCLCSKQYFYADCLGWGGYDWWRIKIPKNGEIIFHQK
jgi:hypothetical protein